MSYSLDSFALEGTDFAAFILLGEGSGDGPTFAYFVVAAVDAFAATISDIQKRITLNGAGFFDGIDGGLQAPLLNAASDDSNPPATKQADAEIPEGTSQTDDTAPESASVSEDTFPESTEVSGSKCGKFGDRSKSPKTQPTEAAEQDPETDTTPESKGGQTVLIAVDECVSPQWGNRHTCDADRAFDTNTDEPDWSDTEIRADRVTLLGTGNQFKLLAVVFQSSIRNRWIRLCSAGRARMDWTPTLPVPMLPKCCARTPKAMWVGWLSRMRSRGRTDLYPSSLVREAPGTKRRVSSGLLIHDDSRGPWHNHGKLPAGDRC